ncbi:hypothetical protein M0D69_08950 [Caballeronia sp. SEWSISQ10-4 2]|uniref:hypothetical protein n=1 Tax=Caballeronia sp. SEWSISQ10-4 2 TaxID=2937438 RepID=UPI00265607E4|nr:hypothetical protein [Caballeronia sp. SEWSISQ10-4 2]MDN7178144.1 hypothetical protein [Caballeronia sp. SEWSISQ10-4 2]
MNPRLRGKAAWRFEQRRPLSAAATSDAVLHTANADADAVKHHAPAALDELKAQHVAPRRRTRWVSGAAIPNTTTSPPTRRELRYF